MKHRLFIAGIAMGVIVALAWLGLTSYLGAHPVAWPVKVALIGAPLGAVIALAARGVLPSRLPRLIGFALLLGAAFGLAHHGKLTFVASYAEDALAGQFWFFGWIATCAMATALLATALGRQS